MVGDPGEKDAALISKRSHELEGAIDPVVDLDASREQRIAVAHRRHPSAPLDILRGGALVLRGGDGGQTEQQYRDASSVRFEARRLDGKGSS